MARRVWLPDASLGASNQHGAMPRIERWCVQRWPVIVTGSGECRNGWSQTGWRRRGPGEFNEQMQGRGRSLDEVGGDIARGLVFDAGAVGLL